MNKELEALYDELEKVKSSTSEYLPEYGYSSKEEIIQLINEDIAEIKEKMDMSLKLCASRISIGYTDESLEKERTQLCLSQGLARYC